MTDEELKGIAAQALNLARKDLERNKDLGLVVATWDRSEGLHRLAKVEKTLEKVFGQDWLNSGEAKDAVFGVFRHLCDVAPPDAIVFVTPINMFEPTAKFDALPPEEQKRMAMMGNDKNHEYVKQGYFQVFDALNAVVQTPMRVCAYTLKQGQDHADAQCFDQENFAGRLKMFGEEKIHAGA